MNRYVIAFGKLLEKYVSDVCDDGMLITTTRLGGYTKHDGTGRTNAAKLFASEADAGAFVERYMNTTLPRGKRHSKLTIVTIFGGPHFYEDTK